MAKKRRIFNFCLPDELREYIRRKADERHTNISQYIIDLIASDKLKTESQIAGYLVFYTKPLANSENSKIKMKVESKIIPVHLKDKFVEKFGNGFGDDFNITESEIEEFLKTNVNL